MIVFPNAKINIGLKVLRKRRDGYHDLESIFYPAKFSDVLEILPSHPELNDGKNKIYVTGMKAPDNEDNLCMKAVNLFQKRHGIGAVRIHLHKNIPPGSGLGGGSSDAAHTLLVLNELFGMKLKSETLKQYAAELGADCTFFIDNLPSIINGKGNVLESISLNLGGYHLVLVLPEIEVSTAAAYQVVRPSEEGPSIMEMTQLLPEYWKDKFGNSFEEPVFRKYPELRKIKDALYLSGAVYASMSGSGSAIFGVFNSSPVLVPQLKTYRTHIEEMAG